ncbi:hypothetical protein T484DRAFT_1904314, partial [Baffinella frigidus]
MKPRQRARGTGGVFWVLAVAAAALLTPSAWGAPSKPRNPTIRLSGPLELTAQWKAPLDDSAESFEILLLRSTYLSDLTSFRYRPGFVETLVINNALAPNFTASVPYAATTDAVLEIERGVEYMVYVVSVAADESTSDPLAVVPAKIMALGLPSLPRNASFCYQQGTGECAAPLLQKSSRFTWLRPLDTGAADNTTTPILYYEIQVAKSATWDVDLRLFNFSLGSNTAGAVSTEIAEAEKGAVHFARVRAVTWVGASPWPDTPTEGRMIISFPLAPALLFVGSGGSPRAFLRAVWNAPADTGAGLTINTTFITAFKFEFSAAESFSAAQVVTVPYSTLHNASFTFVDADGVSLTVGQMYYVRAFARNAVGYGNASNVVRRLLVRAPGVPRNVELRTSGPLSMAVTWTPPLDLGAGEGAPHTLLGYEIGVYVYARGGVGGEAAAVLIKGDGVTSTAVSAPQIGQWYNVTVRAFNEADEFSGKGSSVAARGVCIDGTTRPSVCGLTGLVSLTLPSTPGTFAVRALGSLAIRGAWGRPGETGDGTGGYPLMGYEYVLGEGAGFVNGVETVVGDGVLEVRSGGLGAGVVYAGKVRARNDAGYSNWTGVEEAMALYVPSTPRSLTLALGVESITVSYQVPAETGLGDSARAATGYEVVVSAPCMVQETRVVSGDVFAVTFSRLEKGCVFTFKTRATNEAGSSNYTAEVSDTAYGEASAPRGLSVRVGTAQQVVVTWSVPSDTGDGSANSALVLHYLVEVSPDAGFSQGTLLRSVQTSGFDAALAPWVQVHFRVRAANRLGLGLASLGAATPIIPTLSDASITLGTVITGAAGDVSLSLTTNTSLQPEALLAVVFPAGVDISGASVRSATLGAGAGTLSRVAGLQGACGYLCVSATPVAHLAITSTESLPAGARVSLVLGGVVNRRWAGSTGMFQIKTLNAIGNFTIDEALNVSGSILLPGLLPSSSLSLADPHTGRDTTATVTFSTSARNPLPPDAHIRLIYPPQLTLAGGGQGVVVPGSGLTGALAVAFGVGDVTLERSGGGEVARGVGGLALTLSGVKTSVFEGVTGGLTLQILTSAGDVIDEAPLPGLSIAAGALSSASVSANTTLFAFSYNDFKVAFRTGPVGLPAASYIVVTFPLEVNISSVTVDASAEGLDGTVVGVVVGRVLTVTRVGGTNLAAGGAVTLLVRGVRSLYAGATGEVRIETR